MTEQLQAAIDEVMDYFDFEKVQRVMEFLEWKWATLDDGPRVPTVAELRQEARRQLKGVIERECGFFGSGGLMAYYRDWGVLHLAFEVSEWRAEWEVADAT